MATTKIEVDCLHVDQGMGTLVRVYDGDTLTDIAIIDLGSTSEGYKYATSAVDNVIDALRKMKKPVIEMLLVSHQDSDHWSLLGDLKKKIKKTAGLENTEVMYIYRGGRLWEYKAKKALKQFQDAFGVEAEVLAIESSSYTFAPFKGYIADLSGVKIRLLCTNAPVVRKDPGLKRNGTSAVAVMDFNGVTAIIPGDATSDTFNWINEFVFDKWPLAKNPVAPCRLLAVPHHGSLRTASSNWVGERAAKKQKPKLGVAEEFAGNVNAENICASAGFFSQHDHPSKTTMDVFSNAIKDNAGLHTWVWYDNEKFRVPPASTRCVFTTLRNLETPPHRQGWYFEITAKGEIFFHEKLQQVEVPQYQRIDRYAAIPHQR